MAQGQAGTVLQHLRTLMQAESKQTDTQLLQRFTCQRDEDAFAALMLRHGPMVLGLCHRILHHAHDAEDAFQATFLVLARMAGSIRKHEALGSWLHGVAYRTALKARQALARQRQLERRVPDMAREQPPAETTLDDLQAVLDEEVNRLPEKYRVPFVLCCLESKSREEVVAELGWKAGTLASRLAHARKLLQDRLSRRGVTHAGALGATALTVPCPLAATTLQAALQFATGQAPVGISAQTSALAEAVLKAMFLTRIKRLAVVLLALLLLTAGVGLAANQRTAGPETAHLTVVQVADLPNPVPQPPNRNDRYGDPLPDGVVARFGTVRLRQCGPVVFTPDGKQLITASGPARSDVVFWDRFTGQELRRLKAKSTIQQLHLSPDGQRLMAMFGFPNAVWDVASGKPLFTFFSYDAGFTSDGRHLLGDRALPAAPGVGMWEVATGKQVQEWKLPPDSVTISFSPDGKTVAFALQGSVVLFDLGKKAEIRRWASAGRFSLTFSPDGKRLVAAGHDGVRLWDVATGKEELFCNQRADDRVVFSSDGKRLAWSGFDDKVGIGFPWVVDVDQGKPRHLGGPINNLSGHLAFSPDGKILAVAVAAGALELRDVATGKDTSPLDANTGRICGLALSPDGKQLVTQDTFRLLVWDTKTTKVLRRFPDDLPPGEVAVTATVAAGKMVTANEADNTLHVCDLATGKKLLRLQTPPQFVGSGMYVAAVTPDGQRAALLGRTGIVLFDLTTGKTLLHFPPPLAVWSVGLSADGQRLRVLLQDQKKGLVPVYLDAQTGQEIDPAKLPQDGFSRPGGRWPDYFGQPALAKLQQLPLRDAQGKPAFAAFPGTVQDVVESLGGRYVAVRLSAAAPGHRDSEAKIDIRVWEATTGKPLAHVQPPADHYLALFSPDNRLLVTTTLDGSIHLWELATGKERLTLKGHLGGGVPALLFTPDQRFLISGGDDSQVLLWDLTGRV
jgi:RNA polymerase sigma factor (sigma-70 family)